MRSREETVDQTEFPSYLLVARCDEGDFLGAETAEQMDKYTGAGEPVALYKRVSVGELEYSKPVFVVRAQA